MLEIIISNHSTYRIAIHIESPPKYCDSIGSLLIPVSSLSTNKPITNNVALLTLTGHKPLTCVASPHALCSFLLAVSFVSAQAEGKPQSAGVFAGDKLSERSFFHVRRAAQPLFPDRAQQRRK